jgi:hypothetical protein
LKLPLPRIDAQSVKKPIGFDPARGRFILFDDVVSGREAIVPLDRLTPEQLKQLVIERQRQGRDYTVQSISGPAKGRDDVIRAIENDEPFGRMTVEAEASYLNDLLAQIADHLQRVRR